MIICILNYFMVVLLLPSQDMIFPLYHYDITNVSYAWYHCCNIMIISKWYQFLISLGDITARSERYLPRMRKHGIFETAHFRRWYMCLQPCCICSEMNSTETTRKVNNSISFHAFSFLKVWRSCRTVKTAGLLDSFDVDFDLYMCMWLWPMWAIMDRRCRWRWGCFRRRKHIFVDQQNRLQSPLLHVFRV